MSPSLPPNTSLTKESWHSIQGESGPGRTCCSTNLEQVINSGLTKKTPKSRRQVRSSGPLTVKDANTKMGIRQLEEQDQKFTTDKRAADKEPITLPPQEPDEELPNQGDNTDPTDCNKLFLDR